MRKFKKGDLVRIVLSLPDCECGWTESMEDLVGNGKAYEISRLQSKYGTFYVATDGPDDGWWFPPEALELVPATYGNEED